MSDVPFVTRQAEADGAFAGGFHCVVGAGIAGVVEAVHDFEDSVRTSTVIPVSASGWLVMVGSGKVTRVEPAYPGVTGWIVFCFLACG